MATLLDEATRNSIIEQAKQRAAASGKSAEQELYSYAQTQGLDANSIDTMMGFGNNATQQWLSNQAGPPAPAWQPPAATGSNLGLTSATPKAPPQLDAATQASIIEQAKQKAAASGKTPEQELYNYATAQGYDAAGIDKAMGFSQGATQSWMDKTFTAAPQGNSASTQTPASGPGVDQYSPQVKAMYEQMQRMNASGNAQGAKDLYNANQKAWGFTDQQFSPYATNGGGTFTPDQIAGWKAPAAQGPTSGGTPGGTGRTDGGYPGPGGGGGGNLGMGSYNPQQNPYLGQMGRDIGNQMFDNWSRNTMPSIRSGAMAAGGFGGSRQGVVEANGMNDMNRQYGQALTSMYGQDWTSQQNRNLQQQGMNNSYDLGLRSSDLGFANLDANINQNNFGNQMAGAQFGLNVYDKMNQQNNAGTNAGTQVQNTPLDYQKYFTGSANATGGQGGTNTGSVTGRGDPYLGAIGGAQMGNAWQYPKQ